MNFTLRQLTYFRALAEHRNFGRAAEACHVTQPALSVQIRTLEDVLGGILVERQARDVVLTPFGRQVLAQTDKVIGEAQNLTAVARDHQSGERRLSLGFIPTLAPYLLPGVLARLRASDLNLQVEIREAKTETLAQALRAGDLDAAVLALPHAEGGLISTPLFEDPFLLAGSAARLEALRANVPLPADLMPEQLLLLEEGHCLSDHALEVCGTDRSRAGIQMNASSLSTLSRLVAEGFGLTLMPELAVTAESAACPGLRVLRFDDPQPARTVALARRASTPAGDWVASLETIVTEVGREVIAQT